MEVQERGELERRAWERRAWIRRRWFEFLESTLCLGWVVSLIPGLVQPGDIPQWLWWTVLVLVIILGPIFTFMFVVTLLEACWAEHQKYDFDPPEPRPVDPPADAPVIVLK